MSLRGRVRLSAGELSWEGRSGDLLVVPDARHSLEALEASAVLLTVAKLPFSRATDKSSRRRPARESSL